jgi:three-Cys-motif partner protein
MDDSEYSKWGGPWTDIKLLVLFKYLEFFTTVLRNKPSPDRPFKLIYIDVFAGSGYRMVKAEGETGEETVGDTVEDTEEDDVEALNERDWRESDGSARLAQ